MKSRFRDNSLFGKEQDIGNKYILDIAMRDIVRGVSSNCGNINNSKNAVSIFGIYNGDITASNRNETLKNNLSKLLDILDGRPEVSFGLLPIAALSGIDGTMIRSIANLKHYSSNTREFIFNSILEWLIYNTDIATSKYGITGKIKIWIRYYPSGLSNVLLWRNRKALKESYKAYSTFGVHKDYLVDAHMESKRRLNEPINLGEYKLLKSMHSKVGDNILNNDIIVFDLETYKNNDGELRVYAGGYMKLDGQYKLYYLDQYKDSDMLIYELVKDMVNVCTKKTTIYAHNFGKFDGVLILKNVIKNIAGSYRILIRANILKLLLLRIGTKMNMKTIRFQDSYLLLQSGLRDLCKNFGLEENKGVFPHEFVNRERINYKGEKPGIEMFKGISELDYNNINKEGWDLKAKCLEYLKLDLTCLKNVIVTFREKIKNMYEIDIAGVSTMPALAFKVYRNRYYKQEMNIRIINGVIHDLIREAFYGGRAEVYKPHGFDLLYYDVNSLFPYAMVNDMPVGEPRLVCFDKPEPLEKIKGKMGFAIVSVKKRKTAEGRPTLPVRIKGKIYYPTGEWTGIYFIPELFDAKKRGYKIKVHSYIEFDKNKELFKDYVNEIYSYKAKSTGVDRYVYKLMLNSLYGRFGMKTHHPVIKIVNEETAKKLRDMHEMEHCEQIEGSERYIVSVDTSKILPYIDLNDDNINNYEVKKGWKVQQTMQSIPIAAAITSYSRMYMNKIIGDKQYNVYYTDTDSIVVDKPLSRRKVSSNMLGKFKLEHKIKEGLFILPKVYYIREQNLELVKFKGMSNKIEDTSIFNDVVDMKRLVYTPNNKEKRLNRDLWKMTGLKCSELNMRYDMDELARKKVVKNGKWEDTKPFTIEELLNNKDNKDKKKKDKDKKDKD